MEVDEPAAPAPAPKGDQPAPRFEIKKCVAPRSLLFSVAGGRGTVRRRRWNAVCMWSWDICADTCAICRNSLNEPSIEYQANPSPNNENGPVAGVRLASWRPRRTAGPLRSRRPAVRRAPPEVRPFEKNETRGGRRARARPSRR